MNEEQFLDMIDAMVPPDIHAEIIKEYDSLVEEQVDWVDLMAFQEKARNLTVKRVISRTHDWNKATITDNSKNQKSIYYCNKCHIRASSFENINALSIIKKVTDGYPTYTTHNQYIMFTCAQAQEIETDNGNCYECGIGKEGITPLCQTI